MKKIIGIALLTISISFLVLGVYIYLKPLPPVMVWELSHPMDYGTIYALVGSNQVSSFKGMSFTNVDTDGLDYSLPPSMDRFPEKYPVTNVELNFFQKLNILRILNKITVREFRYKPIGVDAIDKYFYPPYNEKTDSLIFEYYWEPETISYDFVVPDPDKNEYVINGGENLAKLAIAMVSYNQPPEPLKNSIHKWIAKFDGNVVRKKE